MSTGPALELRGITSGYAGVPAVRDLDVSIRPGEVLALLGPNGAGKTTTLLTACGLLAPISGAVSYLGRPLHRRVEHNARAGLVLVPDNRGIFGALSVEDNLRLAARRRPTGAVLDRFPQLRPLLTKRCGLLSGGEQQMVALAKAMLAEPQVLLVDEMSLGLAPIAVQALMPVIRSMADDDGIAVVLVEQHIDLALSVADQAVVLHHGRVALRGPASELREAPQRVEDAYFGRVGADDPAA